jgi:glutamine amidotransferase
MGAFAGSGTRLRIAVLDYGAANMVSISQALVAAGAEAVVAAGPADLPGADALVVPGVGAAAPAMVHLREQGLLEPLRDWVGSGRPCLGICLGFQLLFDASDEGDSGDSPTLGLLAGRTVALQEAPTLPHIGWNSVEAVKAHPLFDGIADGSYFYFVHTFAPVPADEAIVVARTTHGRPFVSAVASGSLYGLQFHPEKSADAGQRLLRNFLGLVAAGPGAGAAVAAAEQGGGTTVATPASEAI